MWISGPALTAALYLCERRLRWRFAATTRAAAAFQQTQRELQSSGDVMLSLPARPVQIVAKVTAQHQQLSTRLSALQRQYRSALVELASGSLAKRTAGTLKRNEARRTQAQRLVCDENEIEEYTSLRRCAQPALANQLLEHRCY